jgi:ribosome-associated protein
LRAHTIEQKKRIATKPTRASNRRRIESKKARASTKQLRGSKGIEE